MKKNMNKLMYLTLAGTALRDQVSKEEAQLISRYLTGRES